jgi:DHA1 family bicyclomycin/chloramphenicol resistance-like MFS transporter
LSEAQRRRLVPLLPALVAFQAISTDLYLPTLPTLVQVFGTDVATVQLTLSLFLLGFAVAQLGYGPASDRFGRRPALLAGTALYLAASIACALASSIEQLILFRVLQGVGACAGPVLGRAVVRDVYGPEQAARVLAYLAAAMAIAPTLGPVLGGYLTLAFGWRASFVVLVVFGALVFVGVLALLPETNRNRDPAALQPRRLAANYAGLLGSRVYVGCVLVVACTYTGIFAFISGSSHVLIGLVGLTPDLFGLCFATGVLGFIAGSLLAGRLALRVGTSGLLALGTAIGVAGGALGLLLALLTAPSVAGVVVPMVVFMLGSGLIFPSAIAVALAPYPTKAGLASALLGFVQLLVAAGTGILVSTAFDHDPSARPMMLALALVTAGAFLAYRRLVRKR